MNSHDTPDITAYALGELNSEQSAKVRQLMAKSPEARAEYDRIQQTVAVLKKAPPFPKRSLNPRQRETVLTMGQPVSRQSKVIPFTTRPAKSDNNPFWQVAKIAAVLAVTSGAFFIGQKTSTHDAVVMLTDKPENEPTVAKTHKEETRIAPVSTMETEMTMQNLIAQDPQAPETTPVIASVETKENTSTVVKSAVSNAGAQLASPSATTEKSKPLVATAAPTPVKNAASSLKAFNVTANAQESVITLHPKLIRSEPAEFAGIALAAPTPLNAKPVVGAVSKPDAQPPLIIHSWKAEIASCPWDSNRRLMRFVAQIPVSQAAIDSNEADYNLSVKFDPAMVQGYRLVTEKHMQASKGGTQATRFAWYEIIPTPALKALHNKPATIGSLDIIQPRGTNFPSSGPLKLVDRGQDWNDSREDFVFETAMVGFSLLLQGSENIGDLNHKLVLDLAEKTKGEDPKGERAKFIQVVKQAQHVTGL